MVAVHRRARDGQFRWPARPARPFAVAKPLFDNPKDHERYEKNAAAYEAELTEFHKRLSQYNVECQRIDKLFREELEYEFKMVGHPKADLLYRLAHERGVFSGKEEIALCYGEFYELLK